jgi:GDPmannose 4,6-dehydratase
MTIARRALITGISGQDGSYLAEFLLARGYEVHGTIRPEVARAPGLLPEYIPIDNSALHLHACDLAIPDNVARVFHAVEPHECYHLGGPSVVDSNVSGNALSFQTILESTRALLGGMARQSNCRLFVAGTSEIFGHVEQSPQIEKTPPRPRSIYGLAKLAAWDLIVRERRIQGRYACVGLLYNHESVRRPASFLPRKVSRAVARIALGLQDHLVLGNLDARRDWGYAPDYVEAMWLILQNDVPDDFIIATGATHQVRELVTIACAAAGIEPERHVVVDQALLRPLEHVTLCGDARRLTDLTGWRPRRSFHEMIAEMVRHDIECERKAACQLAR